MTASARSGEITLDFSRLGDVWWDGECADDGKAKKPRIENISAAAWTGKHLWAASDEGAMIERLSADPALQPPAEAPGLGNRYGAAEAFSLADLFAAFAPLAGNSGAEVDIEALSYDPASQRLWMTGAHCWSLGRKGDRDTFLTDKKLVRRWRARTLLGFLGLDDAARPVRGVCLPAGDEPGGLIAAVAGLGDPVLGPSLSLLSKEGGFDVEGLAVSGTHLLIGLRGPLHAGAAILLDARVTIAAGAMRIDEPVGVVRLDLDGRGVRDLLEIGPDLLVLAGPGDDERPAGGASAPPSFAVYRWRNARAEVAARDRAMPAERLELVLDLAASTGEKPEGLALLPGNRLLVVSDSPSIDRLAIEGRIAFDVYELPGE